MQLKISNLREFWGQCWSLISKVLEYGNFPNRFDELFQTSSSIMAVNEDGCSQVPKSPKSIIKVIQITSSEAIQYFLCEEQTEILDFFCDNTVVYTGSLLVHERSSNVLYVKYFFPQ